MLVSPAISFNCLYAQYKALNFSHITTESGLPQEYLFYSIIQDSRGFMWFCSENGLHRYDGYEFTNFYHNPDDSASISGNALFHIMEDVNKNLWIATNEGVNMYDWSNNSFKHIPFTEAEGPLKNGNNNYSTFLLQGKNKSIYLSTNSYLYQYDTIKRVFVTLSKMLDFPEANGLVAIRTMAEDKDGNLWLTTQEKGLYFLDLKNKKIISFSEGANPPNKILSNNILSILIDSNQEVWVGSDKGLNRINIANNENITYVHDPKNPGGLSHNFANYIYEDDLNNVWISTDGGGLNLYDRKTNNFIHFNHNKEDGTSLLGDKTNLIYENRQGLLWVASVGRGINLTNLKKSGSFKTYASLSDAASNLSNIAVTSIIEDDQGGLWIGTDGEGLHCFNFKENKFTHYKSNKNDPNSLPSNSIISLYVDRNKELWVGTYQGGLSKFNKSGKNFTNYISTPGNSNSIVGFSVFAIGEDKNGNIISGGHNSGINILDKKTNTISQIFNDPDNSNSLSSNYIISFYTDKQGVIWIGTYYGLNRWDQETNTFTNYFHNDNDKSSLSHDWVYSITEDSKNNLWIGTAAGLNLFNRDTKKFESFSKKDIFVNDEINGIIEDKRGNLWMSTNGGLMIFNPVTKEVKNYDVSDGLPGNDFMKCAYCKGKNGELYFGNTKGLVYFLPEEIKTNIIVPPVYITDFYIYNNQVPVGKRDSPLKKQIIETKEIILKHDQTFITLKYASLNYESPEKNQYAYILEGFDKDWHYVGNERKATYSSLDAGEYIFRVKGSNNDGIWNEEGASVKIIVLPPWWKTWWFELFLIIFAITCITGLYYFRINSLRRQKKVLELKVLSRTEELNKINITLGKQSEELLIYSENLKKTNDLLIEKQKLIEAQKEELLLSNEKLLTLNATKDKLFSVLGHDLKTPFNALIGFGELLIENIDAFSPEKIKEILVLMNEGVLVAYDLLENLLNWARAQRGAIEVYATRVNLTHFLEDTLKISQQQAQAKNISLEVEVKGNEEFIFVDRVILGTILRNIVSNSIKFSNLNSKIQIRIILKDHLIEFCVKDHGVGISDEIKERLFKVNNVVSKRGTSGEKGTGLGLLVCAEFINLLKGRIWVESELNIGTTFYFEIPG